MLDRTIVLVDFDRTLVREDTLRLLFRLMAKCSLRDVVLRALRGKRWREIGPHRAIKEQMYYEILRDRTESELRQGSRELAKQIHLNLSVLEPVQKLHEDGAEVVVATASLQPVVKCVVENLDLPVDKVYGTHPVMEFGIYNGELLGGECQRAAKAQRIVAEQGVRLRDRYSVAYGNMPADREMLELATEAYVVRGDQVRPFQKFRATREGP